MLHALSRTGIISLYLVAVPAFASSLHEFDSSNEGWEVVAYPFRSHVAAPLSAPLPFDGAVGNPAGSVRVGDVFAETGIRAPADHLGDQTSVYGGTLRYDILIRFSDNATYPAVVLNGGTKSLYYDTPSPVVGEWETRVVPLSEAGWMVSGTFATATQQDFIDVLSNLVGVYIYTEWNTGVDDTSVDNISMPVANVDTDGDGVADVADNCRSVSNADQRDTNSDGIGNACDADLNGDCLVNFGDLALLKAGFFPVNNPDADFTGDSLVNFGDLALMKSTFFNSATPGPGPGTPGNFCE